MRVLKNSGIIKKDCPLLNPLPMDVAIVVAQAAALTYLSAGVAVLSGKLSFDKMLKEFEKSSALTFMTGFTALIIGVLLVNAHNLWVEDWRVLVTIIGWASLIKGVMLMAMPDWVKQFKGMFKNSQPWGVFMIVLGLLFGYLGFIA
jgi:predicted MFS family arabinose efflux permease